MHSHGGVRKAVVFLLTVYMEVKKHGSQYMPVTMPVTMQSTATSKTSHCCLFSLLEDSSVWVSPYSTATYYIHWWLFMEKFKETPVKNLILSRMLWMNLLYLGEFIKRVSSVVR